MDNEELNERLRDLDDADIAPDALVEAGKVVAYYGWFWRRVNFDEPLTFAYLDRAGPDAPAPGWVGFCEANKWGYPEYTLTREQSLWVRGLCEQLVQDPTKLRATILFDYMQSTRPR
jgi:hypothetical protein